ncbi:MAG: dipeptidase [Anaerolineae bacterium]|nr:dipeptidase [Anaerolineae bacterium]
MTPFTYAEAHAQDFVEQLKEWLRIPSISTQSELKPELERAAFWLRDHCLSIGLTRAEVFPTPRHPVVYAEWLGAGPNAPTVLVYGHYDVQPVDDPYREWKSDPFEPVEREGHLYGRGATDDKGQTFIHLKAFEAHFRATGSFPVNVKFLVEGEEESGSESLPAFIQANVDLLRADVLVISDSHIISTEQPSLVYGLRGIFTAEVEVFGPRGDLHSGSYGGTVHNPVQALVEILAQLHDAQGRVTVPGFYDDVLPLLAEDRRALAQSPMDEARLVKETGVPRPWGEPDYSIAERIGARPTLELNGIVGGWIGEGSKTVIPARALAKISCRLVPNQDPNQIFALLQQGIAALTPPTVRSEVRMIHAGGPAAMVPIDAKPIQAAVEAYEAVFGTRPLFLREGGSIPIVAGLQGALDVPVVLMGFGLPDDNLHAPNEKFTLAMFHKGIQTMLHFYQRLPALL